MPNPSQNAHLLRQSVIFDWTNNVLIYNGQEAIIGLSPGKYLHFTGTKEG
jgi:hypothetical protein